MNKDMPLGRIEQLSKQEIGDMAKTAYLEMLSNKSDCTYCGGPLKKANVVNHDSWHNHHGHECAAILLVKRDDALVRAEVAEGDLKTLRAACQWPVRTDMKCNWCELPSSALTCYSCGIKLNWLSGLVAREIRIEDALKATEGKTP